MRRLLARIRRFFRNDPIHIKSAEGYDAKLPEGWPDHRTRR